MAEDLSRIRKMLLLALSTTNGNEAATAIEMTRKALQQQGRDIHWLAARLESGSGGSSFFNGGSASFQDVERARRDGHAAGYREGHAKGYAEGLAIGGFATSARSNGAGDWKPGGPDPLVWDGEDPVKGSDVKMPPQRWATWLLARRRSRLTEWERGFCELVAHWVGTPTDKQKDVLQRVIHKVW